MTTATLAESAGAFDALALSPLLVESLHRAAYHQPTPIQAALIPSALLGRDVIGQAQTGTGKTAAFLLPFMSSWSPEAGYGPQALVLAPTRELVVQVRDESRKIAPSPECKTVAIYGGQRIRTQINELKAGCHIAVGTPGRILDLLARGILDLSRLRYLVLDEADRMLDIGFRPDIERILRRCTRERQTLLMSATMPEEVLRLVHRYMRDPLHINLAPDRPTVDKIRQSYFTVDPEKKFELLLRVLVRDRPRQCIIFTQTKRGADKLYAKLKAKTKRAAVMHGDLAQPMREKIMQAFRDRRIVFLIATDVVGRGIDVTGISHVINFDLPEDIENYVHRIGRTGRMGADGVAISFVTPEQGKILTDIEGKINKLIMADQIPGFQGFEPRTIVETTEAPKAVPVFGRATRRYSKRL